MGPHDNLLLGCNPGNNREQRHHAGHQCQDQELCRRLATSPASDEVWFNRVTADTIWARARIARLHERSVPDRCTAVRGARRHRRNQRADRDNPAVVEFTLGCGRLQAQPHFRSTSCARRRWLDTGGDTTTVGAGICGGTTDASPSINTKSTMTTTKAMMTTKMIAAVSASVRILTAMITAAIKSQCVYRSRLSTIV